MARCVGRQPRYSPKQLNYVWSVLALDKKKHKASHVLAHVRGWIQAVATILTNIHLPNFFKGEIYRGNAKTVCVWFFVSVWMVPGTFA